jgi:hypothetical protein
VEPVGLEAETGDAVQNDIRIVVGIIDRVSHTRCGNEESTE